MRGSKRTLIMWGVSLFAVVCIVVAFREQLGFIEEGLDVASRADTGKSLVVVLLLVFALLSMGEVMYLLLESGAPRMRRRDTAMLTFAANSWSTTLPGGPAFSAIFTFQVQRSWGASVVLVSWFIVLSGVLSTMWLAVLGLVGVLLLGAHLSLLSLIGTIVIMVGVATIVYWVSRNPETVTRCAVWVVRQINRLSHGPRDRWVPAVRRQFLQLRSVVLSPGRFAIAAMWSLANWVFDILGLWAAVWAITGSLPWLEREPNSTTIVGVVLAFVTAKIAGSAQVTPGGIGPVEAAMVGTLVATGMTASAATASVIIYRLVSLILITAIGWVIYLASFVPRGLTPATSRSAASDKLDS
ncbi:YbhN family protein [Corynebacterium uropygiale]|uniref:YbhN family protein n=1 Tax=Corynebacterium uropygiale TaxID=1775911 RepID=A0A9X1TYI4_9CORY|nr:YbhN family protein [Corynebacterium uropygiale]MCF4007325.1 YbhN family protein [Corynebacterium uropygiale]